MISSKLARLLSLACVPFAVVACIVDNGPDQAPYGAPSSGGGTVGGTGSTSSPGDGAPSAHPMTAIIDTNQTMDVRPGQGVGVFAEYDTGGNWNVWWTCDSSVDSSNPACAFDVKITAQSGQITNLVNQKLETGDSVTQPTTGSLEAITTTSTGTDGVTFTTTPGAQILVDATIGGEHDGQFIFFVQDGHINDNYAGTVTDPIYMVGSSQ
jgi:hypothetical protein